MTNKSPTKTALITGASGGIGYEFAQIFAREKYNLVLVARSQEKLEKIANELTQKSGISVKVIVEDLSIPDASERIFQELQKEAIKIDVLVNNAGFGAYGFFAELDLNSQMQMLQVNIVTLTHLTKLFLGNMIAQKSGKILNIASTAAFQPGPLMAVYYAAKAYVLSFSEALNNELTGTGVSVTALCPGPTASDFSTKANLEESDLFKPGNIMSAKTVAEIGYRGLMNQKTVIIPGFKNQFLAFTVRLLPRNIVTKITRKIQEK